MSFGTVKDSILIRIEHQSQYLASYIFRISFKFTDGSVIIKNKGGEGYSLDRLGYNNKSTFFLSTKEEVAKFSTILIEKIRVEFASTPDYDPVYEKVLKSKKSQPFIDAALCLLNDLN